MDEATVKKAFKVIILECKNEYAKSYAAAGLGLSGEALKIQCQYVLCNLQYWRGHMARDVKEVLRRYVKEAGVNE